MANTSATQAPKGRAVTVKRTFSRETSVSIDIQADAAIIWSLLTNASDYPRWNSTIISIEGAIEKDGKIKLRSTLDPKRIFKLKIKEFIPERSMIWGSANGKRTYTLIQNDNGSITFSMHERIGGLMFPLYAGYIPPFDKAFEQFAADLKKEAEAIMRTK